MMSFFKNKLRNYPNKKNLYSDAVTIIEPKTVWQIIFLSGYGRTGWTVNRQIQ